MVPPALSVLVALASAVAFPGLRSSAAKPPIMLGERDSAWVRATWSRLHPDTALPRASWALSTIAPASDDSGAVLLRDGTECGRIDAAELAAWRDGARRNPLLGWIAPVDEPGTPNLVSRLWPKLRSPDSLLALGRWPAGLDAGFSGQFVNIPLGGAEWERRIQLGASARLGRHLVVGGGMRRSRSWAPLLAFGRWTPDSLDLGTWGWQFSIAAPFVRYEIRAADEVMPEFRWLDRMSAFVIHDGVDGNLLRSPGDSARTLQGNYCHSFSLRAGHFRWTTTVDGDVYRHPVHHAAVDELGFAGVSWGTGIWFARTGFMPGAWFDLFRFSLPLPRVAGRKPRLLAVPLRVDLLYRDPRNLVVSLGTRAHFDELLEFPLPGGFP